MRKASEHERVHGTGGSPRAPWRWRPTLATVLWALVAVGIVFRVASFWSHHVFWDAAYHIQMGRGFAQGDNFVLPWGDPFSPAGSGYVPGPSHHYSPLYPMYLGAFYAAFGYSMAITRVAAILMSIACLAAIYLTSRDLLGGDKALVVTAVLALDPTLLVTGRDLMPEPMVLALFVITMWAIVRGIEDDRYMLVAALCAGGGYLSKSSVGALFIIAGVGGFVWRFAYIRWGVFRRKHYLAAIVVFLSIVGAWSLRNISTFGWPNWQTSPYLDRALRFAFHQGGEFVVALAITVPFFAAIILSYAGYWLPWARSSLRKVRRERTSALWLSVGLVIVISLWFSASLAIYEGTDLVLHSATRARYLVLALPPLLWAVMDEVELGPLDVRLGLGSVRSLVREAVGVVRSLTRRRSRACCIVVLLASSALLILIGREYVLLSWLLVGGAASLLLLDPRKVLVVMLVFLLLPAVERATQDTDNPYVDLAEDLDPMLGANQTVALDHSEHEMGYLYLGLESFDFAMEKWSPNGTADFIISADLGRSYPGYTLVGTYDARDRPGLVVGPLSQLVGRDGSGSTPTVALWRTT